MFSQAKKVVNYAESEDEDDEDEFKPLDVKARRAARRPAKRRKTVADDDDDDFSHASEAEVFHEGKDSPLQPMRAIFKAYFSLIHR